MIEGLKPYAEYKESGLPWLDTVPEALGNGSESRIDAGRNAKSLARMPPTTRCFH